MSQSITFECPGSDMDVINGEYEVYEVNPPGHNPPATIIRNDQKWGARFKWTQTGASWPGEFGNKFRLKVYLEKMGGSEFDLPNSEVIQSVSINTPHDYEREIEFDAGIVPAGLYRAVAIVTYENNWGTPLPLAGFTEGIMVNFYDLP